METEQKARALQHWTDQARLAELESLMQEAIDHCETCSSDHVKCARCESFEIALKGGDLK